MTKWISVTVYNDAVATVCHHNVMLYSFGHL